MKNEPLERLFRVILSLESIKECSLFFDDLCTTGELKSLAHRLEVAYMLRAGKTYAEIVEKTGASTAIISRVSRSMQSSEGGYAIIFDRIKE